MPLTKPQEDRLGTICDSIQSMAESVAKLTPRIDAYCDSNSSAYEAAWNKFKAASQVWREAQRAYRAREIDDAAFLAAKATFAAAQQEMDRATPPGH